MGEIADMMLDGTLCEWCGAYLGEGDGFTRRCDGCKKDAPVIMLEKNSVCPECGKALTCTGIFSHYNAKHPRLDGELRAFETFWQRKHQERNKKAKQTAWLGWIERANVGQ